jgi:hypothetical protein
MRIILNLLLLFFIISCNSSPTEDIDEFTGAENNDNIGNTAISFSPSSKDFGSEYVGDSTDPEFFTLTNIASKRVIITSIIVEDSNFNLLSSDCFELSKNQTCEISIEFAPRNSGNFSASAIVNYIYEGKTYVLSLGFTGRAVSLLNFSGITLVDEIQATTVKAHWEDIDGAVSYLIFYKNPGGSKVFLGSTNTPNDNFSITGLTPGTSYDFVVEAVDFNSGITESGVSLNATTVAAPVLTTINNFNFPNNYLEQTVAMNQVDINNTVSGNDDNISYTCFYDKVVNNSVNVSTAATCDDLPGTASFNTSAGILNWTPNNNAFGAYEVLITGNIFVNESSDTEYFVLSVKGNYSATNLLIDLDAQFANYSNAFSSTSNQLVWRNIHTTGSTYDGDLLGNSAGLNWRGTGVFSDPYSLLFTGTSSHRVDLGSSANSLSDMMISMWINPTNSSALGTVIAGNKGTSGDGFEIRQSPDNPGKLKLMIGTDDPLVPYETRVLGLSPVAYYRLDESSGLVANDSSSSVPANDGTYSANVTLSQTGAIAGNDAVRFTGVNTSYIDVPDSATLDFTTNGLTFSTWVYLEGTSNYRAIFAKGNSGNYDFLWAFQTGTQKPTLYLTGPNATWNNTATSDVPLNTWTHIAVSFNRSTRKLQYYINGIPDGNYTTPNASNIRTAFVMEIGTMLGHTYPLTGRLDEVAIFNSPLTDAQVYNLYNSIAIPCESTSSLINGTWTNIAATYEDSSDTAKLYINGEEECSAAYGNTFSPATTSLHLGARSDATNSWSGSIANFKLYSSGGQTEIQNVLSETRIPFIDVGNLVPDNLVLNLDAAVGNGTSFPGSGCSYTNWVDLSNKNAAGTFMNFASCDSESGWNGTGTGADPYRLDFNATAPDDYVSFPDDPDLDIANEISIMLWIKPDLFGAYRAILGKGVSPYNYLLSIVTGTQRIALYTSLGAVWTNQNNTDLVSNAWQFIAVTFNATTGALNYYYNGAADGSYSLSTGTMTTTNDILEIGNMINNGYPFDGSIANVLIYDRALTADEVFQNCLAHNGNFAGVLCSQ